jgi:hypothetical protein
LTHVLWYINRLSTFSVYQKATSFFFFFFEVLSNTPYFQTVVKMMNTTL